MLRCRTGIAAAILILPFPVLLPIQQTRGDS
jgi:hypothetical protein